MVENQEMESLISIGELSRLTGITTHTLRVWEKRYGSPCSQRLPSGHRRYFKEDIPRLRAVSKALESGYRASKVVPGTLEELHGLMGLKHLIDKHPKSDQEKTSNQLIIDRWISFIHDFHDDCLLQSFHQKWNQLGPLNFIVHLMAPFIEEIGKAWELEELTISQEHFATECIVSFLTNKWRQLNIRKEGWTILMATLPGETQLLGMLMATVIASLSGGKVIFLGPNTPLEDVVLTAKNQEPQLICFSISCILNPLDTEEKIYQIKNDLKNKISIVCGGKGAPKNLPNINRIEDFSLFNKWLEEFESNLRVLK